MPEAWEKVEEYVREAEQLLELATTKELKTDQQIYLVNRAQVFATLAVALKTPPPEDPKAAGKVW